MKTVLITGANRGIGYELTRQYKEKGYNVIAVCRKKSKDLEALKVKIVENIEVTNSDSLLNLKKVLGNTKIDILINNAGIFKENTLENIDIKTIREQFEVNAIAPLNTTVTLLDNLTKGSIVGIVTSMMGSIADNTSGGYYGYRMSKAAVNMAAMSLSRDLVKRGVAIILLHPGYVKTDMTGHNGNITPDVSAAGLIKQIEKVDYDSPVKFVSYEGKNLPW